MKRTFEQASLRGQNKWLIKSMAGRVINKLKNLNRNLLTDYEKELVNNIITSFNLLSSDLNFDTNTVKLGFKVIRYDFLIIEDGVSYKKIGQTATELRFWKKETTGKVEIIKKYEL